jgi:hypothetical protein
MLTYIRPRLSMAIAMVAAALGVHNGTLGWPPAHGRTRLNAHRGAARRAKMLRRRRSAIAFESRRRNW